MSIVPVLLAGGAGTRLWPLSRKSYPKQFADLVGEESLFQASARRLSGPDFAPPLVVTGADFRFIVSEQLASADLPCGDILIEPGGRNTAPAVLAAALWLDRQDPDALMLVTPSDHAIPDTAHFRQAVAAARDAARDGRLVTFGITPTRAETGYGYILPEAAPAQGQVEPVRRFIEKPDAGRAEALIEEGQALWNAGIFLFSVRTVLAAFEAHAPDLTGPVHAAVEGARADLDFHRLDPAAWEGVTGISIDHAIMEKADNVSVVPYDGAWSDLGDWEAVRHGMAQDAQGNAFKGETTAIDCRGSLLRSEEPGMEVVGLGLADIAVVATRDAVLVADRARSQQVKTAVTELRDKAARQAEAFHWDQRPWGRFETLALGPRFQVKRIVVKPGGVLSLQSHMHRAEHWIVVEGTAKVTIDGTEQLVSENQSVYVPLGARHRLENPGKVPMALIEVQTGSYLGEDDITRYEDVYAREGTNT
ncbi:MAG: mannose-1-phosphate guanylyltransferase/mannose-6-phosphate isomerase [Roseovarius sp.]|nr:mannose-1-phosphate guanylyltransferase/mannose-6-phosphate isomerase [Roseovarius sp.]